MNPLYRIAPSPREQEVLELLAEGLTLPEIGVRLCLAHETVREYRKALGAKFGAANVAQLMVIATRRGFLPEKECSCA